jgi:hypothetical protein
VDQTEQLGDVLLPQEALPGAGPRTGESLLGKKNIPELLCLIHSEISEAMEGYRNDVAGHREGLEV